MTSSKTAFASLIVLSGLSFTVAACPASLDDRCSEGACVGSAGEGGVDGGPDVVVDAPVDPCIETPTDAKCLDDTTALFVSTATGNDQESSAGTRAKPLKTIGGALLKADQAKRRIYICEGNYAEDVALTPAHAGMTMLGGVDCNWNAAPSVKPVVGATANPFKIDGASGVALVDIAVEAKNATTGSSIALLATGAEATLKRVRLVAGTGATPTSGSLVAFVFPLDGALKGNAAVSLSEGGGPKPVTCPGGATTTGGKGGDLGQSGTTGLPGLPPNPGTLSNCTSNVNGGAGIKPPASTGATTRGVLSSMGWVPASGTNGLTGIPGQGGGGGYGNDGAGGGGGAGGCGGVGGPGGAGGGASVALASNNSRLTVTASALESKAAGSGAAGAVGQPGQANGGGGGDRSKNACNGGIGGAGGDGSEGGGGAGGVSVGVMYTNTKPTLDPGTEQTIKVGAKGSMGAAAPNATNPGIDGAAELVLEAK